MRSTAIALPRLAALPAAAALAEAQLVRIAPELVRGFREALPVAAGVVGRRLRGALHREGLVPGPPPAGARRHGFGRVEFTATAPTGDPARLLAPLLATTEPAAASAALAVEIVDATVNLAIAYARGHAMDVFAPAPSRVSTVDSLEAVAAWPADEQIVFFERLGTEGHNLHPCGRTRLGWSVADVLAHDLETAGTSVAFVAVDRRLLRGEDIGALLHAAYPGAVPDAPPGLAVHPVHAWQLGRLTQRYADLVAARALTPLPGAGLPARPTAALRTLLLPAGRAGRCWYIKLSLDIQVTSTRRTISVASARNAPAISALLLRLLAADPAGHRILLLAEEAGAALDAGSTLDGRGRDRDATAILRAGLDGRLEPGELAVPGVALPGRWPATGRPVLAELVDAYAATRGVTDPAAAAAGFVADYAALLLPPVLRLATRYGVGLEAHLQNCVPTFRGGVPHRMVVRDFAGMRLHLPRLRARAGAPPLWPGSVIGTDDVDVLWAKVVYTALQAHLGELVVLLTGSHGLDEPAAWRAVRGLVDEVYEPLRSDPVVGAAARADHARLTAPRVPHKALVRMRLAGAGDEYVPVENPLHVRA